jgi:SAM-dependent methyltransferase
MSSLGKIYDNNFYEHQSNGSYVSAKEILPVLFDVYKPESIVDFGSGVGTFLIAAREYGIENILGVEGSWVRGKHRDDIPYIYHDLNNSLTLEERFDLAISLEVGEHLEPGSSENFVNSICRCSDVVLFSAALPGQGGKNHINEQPVEFWQSLFNKNDYVMKDFVRKKIWTNKKIRPWYKQNSYIYVKCGSHLEGLFENDSLLNVIHPDIYFKHALQARSNVDLIPLSTFTIIKLALKLGWKRALGNLDAPT